MQPISGRKSRLLFNVFSLPAAILALFILLWLIVTLTSQGDAGSDSLGSGLGVALVVIPPAAIALSLVIIAWHVWMVRELITSSKQKSLFRQNLGILFYPYVIILLPVLFKGIPNGINVLQQSAITGNVMATPILVDAPNANIEAIHTAGDTTYLLTCPDTTGAHIAIIKQCRLFGENYKCKHKHVKYDTLHNYTLIGGRLSPGVADSNFYNDFEGKVEDGGLKPAHYLAIKDEAPMCMGIDRLKHPNVLINYCVDREKIIARLPGYSPFTFEAVHGNLAPISFMAKDSTCYLLVTPKEGIEANRDNPAIAYVAVFKHNVTRVYRVLLPKNDTHIRAEQCFVQGQYCYLYDQWDGGYGKSTPYLYRFKLQN